MPWNRSLISVLPFYATLIIFCKSYITKAQETDYNLKAPRDYSIKPATLAGFIELGGNSGLYSLNIDKIYFYKKEFKLSIRFGFSPQFNGIYVEQNYVCEQNFIFLKNPHHLEIGFGITLQRRFNELPNKETAYAWENLWYPILRIGYRYQKQDDGFFGRVGVTPGITSKDVLGFHANYFQLWAGISAGMSF